MELFSEKVQKLEKRKDGSIMRQIKKMYTLTCDVVISIIPKGEVKIIMDENPLCKEPRELIWVLNTN